MSFERYYRDQYNFGVMEGRLEGERIGEARGELRGRQQEKMTLAMRLKSKGMSDDEVAEMIGVTPEELKAILNASKVHE